MQLRHTTIISLQNDLNKEIVCSTSKQERKNSWDCFAAQAKKERKKSWDCFAAQAKKERKNSWDCFAAQSMNSRDCFAAQKHEFLRLFCSIRMNSWDCFAAKEWILEIVQLDRHSWGAKLSTLWSLKSRSWIHIFYWVILVSLSEQAKFAHSSLLPTKKNHGTMAKDIVVFRFIIECSSLRDFGTKVVIIIIPQHLGQFKPNCIILRNIEIKF